ncbi:MAG: helix-turn-helix domain-containing protein [Burkholderiales bacterium]
MHAALVSNAASVTARQPSPAVRVHLTTRQREVLALLCEGLSNKHIARRLGIAGGTVKVHISSILRALEVTTRLGALVAARRLGLGPDATPVAPVLPAPVVLRLLSAG